MRAFRSILMIRTYAMTFYGMLVPISMPGMKLRLSSTILPWNHQPLTKAEIFLQSEKFIF